MAHGSGNPGCGAVIGLIFCFGFGALLAGLIIIVPVLAMNIYEIGLWMGFSW